MKIVKLTYTNYPKFNKLFKNGYQNISRIDDGLFYGLVENNNCYGISGCFAHPVGGVFSKDRLRFVSWTEITEEYRGKGWGKKLILSWFKPLCNKYTFISTIEKDKKLIPFYQSLGFNFGLTTGFPFCSITDHYTIYRNPSKFKIIKNTPKIGECEVYP